MYVGRMGLKGGGNGTSRSGMTTIEYDENEDFRMYESATFSGLGVPIRLSSNNYEKQIPNAVETNCVPKDKGEESRNAREQPKKLPGDRNKAFAGEIIPTFHVSCTSFRPESLYGKDDMAGMVLYKYDGKNEWWLNGKHCKAGYIVLQKSASLADTRSEYGLIHGKLYKYTFGEETSAKVVGSGFGYIDGTWRFNSYTLNDADAGTVNAKYHTIGRTMGKAEQTVLMQAMRNWVERGQQNTEPK